MVRAFFDESAGVPEGLVALFDMSKVSLTVADCSRADFPLVGVNERFLELSGYDAGEVIGHNCRFLQPEDGPGPVRGRMRAFLQDPQIQDARFLVPNRTKQGTPFVNLIYMARLMRGGECRLILGSQFRIDPAKAANPDVYDEALAEDLKRLNLLTDENNWAVLGTFEALASSHSIIARARYE